MHKFGVSSLYILGVFLASLGAVFDVHAHSQSEAEAVLDAETVAFPVEELSLPIVELINQSGKPFDLESTFGAQPVIISFTYTECETLCPLTNTILQDVDSRLGEGERHINLLSITIDPEKDTPAVLAEHATAWQASPHWIWATGTSHDINRLLIAMSADPATLVSHPPMFLIGKFSTGEFHRIIGLADPVNLIDIAQNL